MNKPWDIIAELEADSSRLAKEAIIKRELAADNAELFRGFRAAYDSMITFGVKKVEDKTGDGKGLTPEYFWDIAKKLADRELSGNAALTAINYMRMNAKEAEWNYWYRRILIKDMKCGTSESTVNKFAPEKYQVPTFTCQLAHDGAKFEERMCGNKLIEVKLDGVRVITIVYPDGKVDQYSRNGKELLNFDHIKKQFAKHAVFLSEPMVFDGEVMSNSFQDLMTQLNRKSNVEATDAVLHLFDMLPLNEFRDGKSTRDQVTRSALLSGWINLYSAQMPNVAVVGQEFVDLDKPAGMKRFTEINKAAIDGGYEGIMLKDPDAIYVCDRMYSWLKVKPFIEVTLTAEAVEEGTDKYTGMMGAVVFAGEDDGKTIRVSCGGGWSDKQRAEVWASYTGKPVTWTSKVKGQTITNIAQPGPTVIGQLGEVRGDALTLGRDNNDVWSIRFPRFKTWRGFATGEKL